jgi:hypothetical protein
VKGKRPTRHTPSAESAQAQALLAELQALRTDIKAAVASAVHKEVRAAMVQLEAQTSLLARINGKRPLPAMHGWPISPDFGLVVTDLLDAHFYHAVVELGSGVSTYIVAALLAKPSALAPVRQHVAIEHQPKYQVQTQALLARLGQAQRSAVRLCPLVPWAATDGTAYSYYDCAAVLADVAATLTTEGTARVLVVVDGPPGASGHWARYPDLPQMLQAMPQAELHLLLDDHGRYEERDLAQAWQTLLTEQGRPFTTQTFPCEKGALLLSISRKT